MANKQNRFRFYKHEILKSHIDIIDPSNVSKDFSIEFSKSSAINIEKGDFKLEIGIVIEDENKNVKIEITSLGYFNFEKDLSEDEKKGFFNTSAPALLFPYLRAYVSTLTALSGISTITLPTLNLSGGTAKENQE